MWTGAFFNQMDASGNASLTLDNVGKEWFE